MPRWLLPLVQKRTSRWPVLAQGVESVLPLVAAGQGKQMDVGGVAGQAFCKQVRWEDGFEPASPTGWRGCLSIPRVLRQESSEAGKSWQTVLSPPKQLSGASKRC